MRVPYPEVRPHERLVALVASVGSFSMMGLAAATFQIDPPPANPTPLAE